MKFRFPSIAFVVTFLLAAGVSLAAPRDVYVVPFSHLDLYWAGTREECLARGNDIITKAMAMVKAHPEFRYLLEDEVFVANYVESHAGTPALEEFKRAVNEGKIEIAPKWAGIYQNIPPAEALARNLIYGKRYARSVFGVDPQVAHMGDLPGYTAQFPQLLVKSGTPFMVMTRMGPTDRSVFRWKAPDGSMALVWHAFKGYWWGASRGLHEDLNERSIAGLKQDLQEVAATTGGPIYLGWGMDLYAPSEKVVSNIARLNQDIPEDRFRLATPGEFFATVAKTPSLPEIAGDIPSSWTNSLGSLLPMWPQSLAAANALTTAEKFAAINYALGYAEYPQRQFEFLWKKTLESMDHNNDGQGRAGGDERHSDYARMAILESQEILRDRLRNIAERVRVPDKASMPIVVFNPTNWTRSDTVDAHVTIWGQVVPAAIPAFKKGMRLVDETGQPVAFYVKRYLDDVSRALEMTFVARDVRSLGYKTYYLLPADPAPEFPKTASVSPDSRNDEKEPRRPLGSDVVENQFYRVSFDKATGRMTIFDKGLNREMVKEMEISAIELRGGNGVSPEPETGRMLYTTVDRISVEENNSVRAVVRVDGEIAGMPVTQRLILYRELRRVDLENRVTWRGGRLLKMEQRFPLEVADARIQYGIPFGAASKDDLFPNSGPHFHDEVSKDAWRPTRRIQDWIFAGNSEWGLTIAADHHAITLGDRVIRAGMLTGVRYSTTRVVEGERVMSQPDPPPGEYVYRYSLSASARDWKAARSYQAGIDFSNPLIPVSVVDVNSPKSLPPTHSFLSLEGNNLVVSALKKSDVDKSVVMRVYEIQGAAAESPVMFLDANRKVREVNLLEEGSAAPAAALKLRPYEIKTVTLDVAR